MADLEKKEYEVLQRTWLGPKLRAVGDIVEMTEDEAQYYVPHILKPKDTAKPVPAPTKDSGKGK